MKVSLIRGSTVTLALLCSAGMLRPASAGLVYEDLASVSAANIDAMAIAFNPGSPSDEATANSDTGVGLPGGSGQTQVMPSTNGGAGFSLASVTPPNFHRRPGTNSRAGNGSGGGNGTGQGLNNSLGSGLGRQTGSTSASGGNSAGVSSSSGSSLGNSESTGSSSGAGGGSGAFAPGTDISNPLMPSSTSGNTYSFNTTIAPGATLFADPPLATGFIFT